MIMAKEKVNDQEGEDREQGGRETKERREGGAEEGGKDDKVRNGQRQQRGSEKLGKTVQVEQPKVAKVRITGKPCMNMRIGLQ